MRVVRPRGCCLVGRLGRVSCFSVVWLVGRLRLACGLRVVGLGSVRLVLGGAVGRLCWGFACGVLPPPPVVALVVSLVLALAAGLGRAVLGVAAGAGALSPLPFCGCLARWLAVGSVCVAGGRWCLAPLRVLVGAGAVVVCLAVRVGVGACVGPCFGCFRGCCLLCRLGACVRARWCWCLGFGCFVRCVAVSAGGCGCAFCFSLRFGFVALGTGLRGGLLWPMKSRDDLKGNKVCGMMRSTVSMNTRNGHALEVLVVGRGDWKWQRIAST